MKRTKIAQIRELSNNKANPLTPDEIEFLGSIGRKPGNLNECPIICLVDATQHELNVCEGLKQKFKDIKPVNFVGSDYSPSKTQRFSERPAGPGTPMASPINQ